VSGLCTAWVAVEILLRVQQAPEWMITGSFVIAILLAAVVVVLAVFAYRQDRRRGAVLGLLAVATAAGDRIALAVFSAFGGL
jgi:predicted small integral membrane protein